MESIGELSIGAFLPRDEDNHKINELLEVCDVNRCVKVCRNIVFKTGWWKYTF